VVGDLAVAGTELDGADELASRDFDGQDEAAEDVGALGVEGERFGELEDNVGLAHGPAFGELGEGREVVGVTLGRAGGGPGFDELDLGVGEAAVGFELAVAGLGLPGGHGARVGDLRDLLGALADVLVGRERERRDLAGVVTAGAVVPDDGGDVFRERRSGFRWQGKWQKAKGKSEATFHGRHFLDYMGMWQPTAVVNLGSIGWLRATASQMSFKSWVVGV
jgi:hypothetical protein